LLHTWFIGSISATTLWGRKNTPKLFSSKLEEKWYNFNKFLHKYSWYNWPSNDCLVSHLTHCLFLHYLGKENENNIAFLITLVLILNQNNTQNTHFVHTFIILANSLSNCPFLTAYKNVWNIGPRTWAWNGDTFSIHWKKHR